MNDLQSLLAEKNIQELKLKKAEHYYENKFENHPSVKRRYYGLSHGRRGLRKSNFKKRTEVNHNRDQGRHNSRDEDKYSKTNKSTRYYDNFLKAKESDKDKKIKVEFDTKKESKTSTNRNFPDNKALSKPRPQIVVPDIINQRNKRFMSLIKNHIKEAKKDLKKELSSDAMKIREESEKRVSEAIAKDRLEFKNEYRRKARQRAQRWLKVKQYNVDLADWKIKSAVADNLIKTLTVISKHKSNFILTKVNPPIYYVPKKMDDMLQEKLNDSVKFQKLLLEKEIEKIKSQLPPKPTPVKQEGSAEKEAVEKVADDGNSQDKNKEIEEATENGRREDKGEVDKEVSNGGNKPSPFEEEKDKVENEKSENENNNEEKRFGEKSCEEKISRND